MWLITPMKSETIVQGWIEGGWCWKARWGGLMLWCFIGNFVGHDSPIGWLGWNKLISTVWTIWILTVYAMPHDPMMSIAVSDALEHPSKVFSQHGRAWSFYRLLGFYALSFGPALAFVLLRALPSSKLLHLSAILLFLAWIPVWVVLTVLVVSKAETKRIVHLLDEIRKAPMEKLPIQ